MTARSLGHIPPHGRVVTATPDRLHRMLGTRFAPVTSRRPRDTERDAGVLPRMSWEMDPPAVPAWRTPTGRVIRGYTSSDSLAGTQTRTECPLLVWQW
jgi:hypothetical protein